MSASGTIVDAHCHAWHLWPYEPAVPDPGRGAPANLLWEMDRVGVGRAVVICASIGDNPDNAGDVAVAARASGGRLVPFADLDCLWHPTYRAVGGAARLDALCARLALKGVTHYMREGDPAEWLLGTDGREMLAAIAARGLILSLACGPFQAAAIARAALDFPELPILIHHLWRVREGDAAALAGACAAARAPNLFVKLSGHGYGCDDGWEYPLPGMQVIVRALLDAYGPRRMVWGSDWPVSTRFMTYRQTLEIVRRHGPRLTPDESTAVLGGTMLRLLDGWRPQ
jgi:L-fuconolactonase